MSKNKPRYLFEVLKDNQGNSYNSPADRIMGKKSTFISRCIIRTRSRTYWARKEMRRIGLWTGFLYQ